MKIRSVTIIFFLPFILVGCLNPAIQGTQQKLVNTPIMLTPTFTPQEMEISETPILSKDLQFDLASGKLLSSDQISSDCFVQPSLEDTIIPSAKGLVVHDVTTKELKTLNHTWQEKPIYIIPDNPATSNFVAWGVSPDNRWISYIDLKRADIYDIWVENPKSGERIQKHVEGKTLGAAEIYWGNQGQIVIPLYNNQGDRFEWLLWKPFSQEEQVVSVELPGVGETVEKYHIFPIYNPNTHSVLYPCQQCGENEFQVLDLDRKKVIWSINYGSGGPFTTPQWAPIVSSGGRFLAFYFGLNILWIINNHGESLFKIILPFGSDENWAGKTFKWSDNGAYLAMIRERANSLTPYLSILTINEGKLINRCEDIGYGNLAWSYDNQNIALLSNRTGEDEEGTLSIIDVKTGKGEKISFTNHISLVGWIAP